MRSIAQDGAAAMLLRRLPKKPYQSSYDFNDLAIRSVEQALTKPYLQVNGTAAQALVFDIDSPYAFEVWEEANLPIPSLIIYSHKGNGHAHYIYLLDQPVYLSKNARKKPLEWLAAVERGYARRLGADLGYAGLLTKNPLMHHVEDTHKVYSLGELDSYLDPADKWIDFVKRKVVTGFGRNVDMFNSVRFKAYEYVKNCGNQAGLYDFCLNECKKVNSGFAEPLPANEVGNTARSISKWTWKNRCRLVKKMINRGRYGHCGRPEAGRKTAKIVAVKTDAQINLAIDDLAKAGKKLTVAAIARAAGVSRPTVYAYQKRQIKN